MAQCSSEEGVIWVRVYPYDHLESPDKIIFRGDSIITYVRTIDPFEGVITRITRSKILDTLFNDTAKTCKVFIIEESQTGDVGTLPICSVDADTILVISNIVSFAGSFHNADSLKAFLGSSMGYGSPGRSFSLDLMYITRYEKRKMRLMLNGS